MRFSDKLARLRPMASDGRAARRPLPDPPERSGFEHASSESISSDPETSERLARLRALMGEVAQRDQRRKRPRRRVAAPEPLPVGERVDRGHGTMYLLERYLDPQHCHGRVPVASALEVPAELIGSLSLDPELADVDPSRMLILDTETTGLAGGTGTVPFLIGLAFFDDGVLKVEQVFLENLGCEAPLLHHLRERIAAASCVVSYNGKSFDWPLLRNRYILNRVRAPELPPHLDLLHCARRVFKERLEAVKLTAIERDVLRFDREGDVPGAEIPGLYMNYLRGGDARGVVPILEHNELDVIALASLLGELGRHFSEVQHGGDARDHLAYARLAVRVQDETRALAFAEAAAAGAEDDELRVRAGLLSAEVMRRRGDYAGAATCLQAVLSATGVCALASEVHLALAKLYEHRLRDLPLAHRHALHTLDSEGPQSHGRRLGRLRRRLLAH
ncbi:MAG: ribonuclease H-like domain-containing protein [Myxococcales bacterium]|nr:ribonuclease H-like domain-containing protein [Myxococcales bacterium]